MSIPELVVYDDATARTFAPFSLTRPLAAMRAGAELISQRWARVFDTESASFVSSPHLAGFAESGLRAASGRVPEGSIVVSSRCVVALDATPGDEKVWRVDGKVAAVRLEKPLTATSLTDGHVSLESLAPRGTNEGTLGGAWLSAPWDLIGQLPALLAADVRAIGTWRKVSGEIVDCGATIEPHVHFDTTDGPIVLREGAYVESFTRIAGPCVVGEKTRLHGGRINGSSIGDDCRIHGDIAACIFIGSANKAHEGFVGHSIIGRWANLGAGTTTSNLKNSYGPVKLWTPQGDRDTGLTFLGSLIGDHAKLGIGTMLNTGTVVGAGANVFGTDMPPKRIAPFAWGETEPYETFEPEKFLEVAARVMKRRNVTLSDAERALLRSAHSLSRGAAW